MIGYLPMWCQFNSDDTPMEEPTTIYFDIDKAHAAARAVIPNFVSTHHAGYCNLRSVTLDPEPTDVLNDLIDEVDERPKHGWISEKEAQAQHNILVEARERLER